MSLVYCVVQSAIPLLTLELIGLSLIRVRNYESRFHQSHL